MVWCHSRFSLPSLTTYLINSTWSEARVQIQLHPLSSKEIPSLSKLMLLPYSRSPPHQTCRQLHNCFHNRHLSCLFTTRILQFASPFTCYQPILFIIPLLRTNSLCHSLSTNQFTMPFTFYQPIHYVIPFLPTNSLYHSISTNQFTMPFTFHLPIHYTIHCLPTTSLYHSLSTNQFTIPFTLYQPIHFTIHCLPTNSLYHSLSANQFNMPFTL